MSIQPGPCDADCWPDEDGTKYADAFGMPDELVNDKRTGSDVSEYASEI